MTTIVLLGTLDTKGTEYEYLRDRVRQLGAETVLVDVGSGGQPAVPADISAAQVAEAAGHQLAGLTDRGQAMAAMGEGAEMICRGLLADGSGQAGLPQVVSLGALDTITFGPLETLPEKMRGSIC
jgi:uncharacterized protein (UPF0261 family)